MITVHVTVGIGGWKTSKTVTLVACPHVGDFILVGEVTVTCQRVTIGPESVYVEETIHFVNEADAKEYFS